MNTLRDLGTGISIHPPSVRLAEGYWVEKPHLRRVLLSDGFLWMCRGTGRLTAYAPSPEQAWELWSKCILEERTQR